MAVLEIMLNVYQVREHPLSVPEAVEILNSPSEDKISSLPPVLPKAGELFLYKYTTDLQKGMYGASYHKYITVRWIVDSLGYIRCNWFST